MRIALTGNPNSGKTTMYNALTGRNERVGNWAGVTVEKKEHPIKKAYYGGEEQLIAVDLPGAYSMSPFTSEESITSSYVKKEHPDVIFDHAGGGGRYRIFAVLFSSLNEEENRKLFSYIDRDPDKPEEWEAFLAYLKKNRLYDTGVEADSGDELLMLSTCYRQIEQGRALIFARKERADEGFLFMY